METLFELAEYNKGYRSIIESLMPKDKNSPLTQLCTIVFSGKIINDKEAMQNIYQNKNISTFSRLKSRLRDILIKTTLLHSNALERDHSRVNESINQFRYTVAAKLLADQKVMDLAIKIAEKSLVKSIKYHSTENILLLSTILIRHYSASIDKREKFIKYKQIQEKYIYIYSWEVKAENYYLDLQSNHSASLASPTELTIKRVEKYVLELEKVKDVKSYLFILNKYKVNALYFEYHKDYNSLLKISDKTISELNTPELRTNLAIRNINLRKSWALIQAGRNIEAVKIGSKDMKDLLTGSIAWYYRVHYVIKAYLYNADYRNSSDLIRIAMENQLFNKLAKNVQEIFYTTLGYMHLIVNSGIVADRGKIQISLPEFKIGKFLNNIPVYSKDKRGINVSILLMHVAFLLQRKNYDKIIDKIDSLNQYAYKYLRKDDTFRSNCMIKMVVQMTKANFHPIRTERYTRDLLKQLEQVKLAGSGENIETEIIPYEVLWSIMLKALQPTTRLSGK